MKIDDALNSIKKLPPAKPILPKLLSLLKDIDADSQDIVDLIKIDSSLTAQVLQMSNSAYYGFSTPCNTIGEALGRIGFHEVYKLVAIVCTRQLLNQDAPAYHMDSGQLWERSLACGLAMENIASKSGEFISEAYTVGLLHSIGKLVINELEQVCYSDVFTLVEERGISMPEAEREVCGFDNAQVGAALLERWKFPPRLYAPIAAQYDPMQAPEDFRGLSCALHVALWVVANIGCNYGKDAWAFEADQEALDTLGISSEQAEALIMKAHDQMAEIKQILGIQNA